MTEEEFLRIVRFLKSQYGIDMSRKKPIVQGRLENYMRMNGFRNYSDFMDAMEKDATGNLEKKLVNLLSTNHTYFMREPEHFTYMRQTVLPWLKKKEERRKDLRIWCGASSTGEEPYTLAMILMDYFGLEHGAWDTKVLATDISTDVLQHAIAGLYTTEQVEVLPDNWKRRFFRKVMNQDVYRVTDELKKEVIFRKFNLMDDFPFRKKLHVVFLRNVMIYFDDRTKRELIQKIYDVMEPGGYLFIGQTESLDKSIKGFEMVKPSIYRKREESK
ncbi:MAG: protein-glutamate O-methyltransferase CheR [Agathobacter sp.]|nr:protein-glutamate O-methyltransferase CheR [Agathobacter sp.]